MPAAPHELRLGKLAPRHDARALPFARYTYRRVGALPQSPPGVSWSQKVPQNGWGMMLNDRLSCCGPASLGHIVQCWSANAAAEVTPSDADVTACYQAVGGYVPGSPATDRGVVMSDLLDYFERAGIAGHKISARLSVEPKDAASVQEAIYLFGGVLVGLSLPKRAQQQLAAGQPWMAAQQHTGDDAPGSWGGHAVAVIDYDGQFLTCVTWGRLQRMSVAFWSAYCDEAYACLSPDWLGAQGQSPGGFDWAALGADMQAMGGGAVPPAPVPVPTPVPVPAPTPGPHRPPQPGPSPVPSPAPPAGGKVIVLHDAGVNVTVQQLGA